MYALQRRILVTVTTYYYIERKKLNKNKNKSDCEGKAVLGTKHSGLKHSNITEERRNILVQKINIVFWFETNRFVYNYFVLRFLVSNMSLFFFLTLFVDLQVLPF